MEQAYRKMKDELDELKSRAEDAKRLEANVETYKRKIGIWFDTYFVKLRETLLVSLEEQSDLKAQLKVLEEKNENPCSFLHLRSGY